MSFRPFVSVVGKAVIAFFFLSTVALSQATTALDAATLRQVDALWSAKCKANTSTIDGKGALGQTLSLMEESICEVADGAKSRERLAALIADKKLMEPFGHFFKRVAPQGMVCVLCMQAERESLINFLASCPVDRIGHYADIEWWLAYASRGRLKDGILILCDAYARCAEPQNKTELGRAIARAFAGNVELKDRDYDSFVSDCRKWYSQNRDRLEVSQNYPENNSTGPTEERPIRLFELKRKP